MTWLKDRRYLKNDEAVLFARAVIDIIKRYEIDNEFKTLTIGGPFEQLESKEKIQVLHITSLMLLTDTGDRHLKRSSRIESAVYYVFKFISNEFRMNHNSALNEWGKYIIDAYRHYPDGSSVLEEMIPKSTSSRGEWEITIRELADRILFSDKHFELHNTIRAQKYNSLAIIMPLATDFDYFSNSIFDNLGNEIVYSENALEDLKGLCSRFVSTSSSSSSNPEININKRKLNNDGESSIHSSDKKSKIATNLNKLLEEINYTPQVNKNNSPATTINSVFSENKRVKWTVGEEEALKKGIKKHGIGKWKPILDDPEFKLALIIRTNVNLKDKFKTMLNQFRKKYKYDDDDHGDDFARLLRKQGVN